MKTLIVYFSKSGRTKGAAEEIASLLEGANLFEIKVDKTYPPSYFKTLFEARREFKSGERPPRRHASRPRSLRPNPVGVARLVRDVSHGRDLLPGGL